MKFVLFRHAHKGSVPFEDPELSPKGFEQSAQIVNLIKNNTLPTPTHLFVSPNRRTSQSFYPLSRELKIGLEIKPDLDQRRNDENTAAFRKRIQNFLNSLTTKSKSNEIIFACTHFDWIEEAMILIDCDQNLNSFEYSNWSPAQFLSFEINEVTWRVAKKGSNT